jgi:glycosyltransferase involved in cell wall biosynthesis
VPEHREVLGEAGRYYRFNDFSHLAGVLKELMANPAQVTQLRLSSAAKAERDYSWDFIVDQYETLLRSVCASPLLNPGEPKAVNE